MKIVDPRSTPPRLISIPSTMPAEREPSRFDLARQESANRTTLELSANLVKVAGDRLARAHALLATAAGSDPAPRAAALEQARASLAAAFVEIGEVVSELG